MTVHFLAVGPLFFEREDRAAALPDIDINVVAMGEAATETSTIPTPDAAPVVRPDEVLIISSASAAAASAPMQTEIIAKQTLIPELLPITAALADTQDALPPPAPETRIEKVEAEKPTSVPSQEKGQDEGLTPTNQNSSHAASSAISQVQARQFAAEFQRGAPAIRAGMLNGRGLATKTALSNYGAIVSAEFNRHKIYPAAARSAGITGNVRVNFTVDPTGRISSHIVVASSGSDILDGAVRNMVAAARFPEPPGGYFNGSVVVHFNLGE